MSVVASENKHRLKTGDLVAYGIQPGILIETGSMCFEDTDQLCRVLFSNSSKPTTMVLSALKKLNA